MFYSAAKYTGAELRFSGWCFSVIKMITDTIESSPPPPAPSFASLKSILEYSVTKSRPGHSGDLAPFSVLIVDLLTRRKSLSTRGGGRRDKRRSGRVVRESAPLRSVCLLTTRLH